ncbi:MAG: hypothetical protein IJA74_07435 [Oscillospiraceae bacterium]|nr:hypothetical protein [Oscillospiraceae bacterium]
MEFVSEYVYILDRDDRAHFVQRYYGTKYDDSYRAEVCLADKKYSLLDLYMTDEEETEGEYLPFVRGGEWSKFFTDPSENVRTIIAEAGLSGVSAEKLLFVSMQSNARLTEECDGFIASLAGVEALDAVLTAEAICLAEAKTPSPAKQEELVAQWLVGRI